MAGGINPLASLQGKVDSTGALVVAIEGSAGFIATAEKGQPNGVATLDGSGKVPQSELPPLEHDVGQAANQAAMLALSISAPAIAIRTDFSPPHVFFLTADPATTLANWVDTGEFGGGGAAPTTPVSLSAIAGVANTFMRSDGAPALSQSIAPTWTGLHTFTQKITLAAVKNYEILAGAIAGDDRLILRAASALAARIWLDSVTGTTGLSFAEAGTERIYFGTALGGNVVLDTKTYPFQLKTSSATNNALLDTSLLSADRAFQFPDAAGTIALASDFPSGTYAPTVTPGSNAASAVANGPFIYARIGFTIQVSGELAVTATAAGPTLVDFTLPVVPPAFASTHQLSGSGAATTGSLMSPLYARANTGATTAAINWIAPNTQAHTMRFVAMYTLT